jgi:hypothetical protein
MPIGWWLTVVQFRYVGLRLLERWPPWMAVGLISVLGMVLPPWYEEFAAPARAWYYTPSRLMRSHVPVWVIGAYGGVCSPWPPWPGYSTAPMRGAEPCSAASLQGLASCFGVRFGSHGWAAGEAAIKNPTYRYTGNIRR